MGGLSPTVGRAPSRATLADVPAPAAEVISRHLREAPVKVGAIAADLGVKVLISDLPLGISGSLSRDDEDPSKWVIRVNRHEHKHRQRFTIAHELAHFVLHRDQLGDGVVDDTFYRSGLPERQEYQANSLAADLLMPWPLLRRLMQEGHTTSDELAEALEVSPAAMHIRLGLPT